MLSGDDNRSLIPELCKQFYSLGWVTGTGGGISIIKDGKIYIAPSGVQKERIKPDEIFIYSIDFNVIYAPLNLKPSACTPLFQVAFSTGAECCIHSHSMNAVLVTKAYSTSFTISNMEMIKGVLSNNQFLKYSDTLVIPIIENTDFEQDLKDGMQRALKEYPFTHSVLVRNHGIYVWGPSWEKCKTMCECLDYLFELDLKTRLYFK